MVLIVQVTNTESNGILSKSADASVRKHLHNLFADLTKAASITYKDDSSSAWYYGNGLSIRTQDITGKLRIS